MIYNLFHAVLYGITSFAFYKLHKLWLRKRIEDEDPKVLTFAGIFKHWIIIIGLAIAAVVTFFKAIYS